MEPSLVWHVQKSGHHLVTPLVVTPLAIQLKPMVGAMIELFFERDRRVLMVLYGKELILANIQELDETLKLFVAREGTSPPRPAAADSSSSSRATAPRGARRAHAISPERHRSSSHSGR